MTSMQHNILIIIILATACGEIEPIQELVPPGSYTVAGTPDARVAAEPAPEPEPVPVEPEPSPSEYVLFNLGVPVGWTPVQVVTLGGDHIPEYQLNGATVTPVTCGHDCDACGQLAASLPWTNAPSYLAQCLALDAPGWDLDPEVPTVISWDRYNYGGQYAATGLAPASPDNVYWQYDWTTLSTVYAKIREVALDPPRYHQLEIDVWSESGSRVVTLYPEYETRPFTVGETIAVELAPGEWLGAVYGDGVELQ